MKRKCYQAFLLRDPRRGTGPWKKEDRTADAWLCGSREPSRLSVLWVEDKESSCASFLLILHPALPPPKSWLLRACGRAPQKPVPVRVTPSRCNAVCRFGENGFK